jgi:nucleotide-binding universal stress UspA family protein
MKKLQNKILVAVDFGEQSLSALEQSFILARILNAGILLLFVIEETAGFSKLISPDDYYRKLLEKAREKFEEIENLSRISSQQQDISVSHLILKGKPYEQILETAKENHCILIFMGKGGKEIKKKSGFFGSNTLNVVRQANCPVITTGVQSNPNGFRNIVMPIDFTGQTKIQVQHAIDFGKYFNATINVLSVVSSEKSINRILRQVQLTQVKNALIRHNVKCNAEFIYQQQDQEVAEIVCNYSVDKAADLIIIMTQLKKKSSRFSMGATAQDIIFSSHTPVLSINPSAKFHPQVLTSFVDPLGLMRMKASNEFE